MDELKTVVLDGWKVNGPGTSDLSSLFPQMRDLDISNCLISNWYDVANITKQLPNLHFLNLRFVQSHDIALFLLSY